jgi:four helix bundle protein
MTKTQFESLRVYQHSEEISDIVWNIVAGWDYFAKDTVGKQLVRAADSVGANIAEGTGRGSYADNKRFVKIARGSLFEVKHWLKRSYKRKLVNDSEIESLNKLIDELTPKISAYINSIGKNCS